MKHRIALALLLAFGGHALADKDKDKADSLFKQGKKFMAEKRYAEACQAFEQSFKLDPGIGGELNIAKCYEDWGKLGRAYAAYQHAEQMAKETNDARQPKIHELVVGLESQVPRLTIKLSGGGDPKLANVTLDDKPFDGAFGQPQVVDPGPHTIEYESAGKKKKRVVPVERGGTSEITLDVAPAAVVKQPDTTTNETQKEKPDQPPPPRDPGRNQKLLAYGAGGVGVVLIGVSSYMTLSAKSRYSDALAQHCGGMTNMCDPTGLSITHDARHEANIATALFLIGVAGVGGGVALYLTAPHAPRRSDEHALYLVPAIAPGAAGIVLGGKL